jgi:HAD superfamily hydrolase (TIGR01509 family)
MPIKFVIFDMNGVITDDEPIHELAFKNVCKKHMIMLTPTYYRKFCMGRTDKECFEEIFKKYNIINISVEDLVKEKFQEYSLLIKHGIKPVPYAIDLTRKLYNIFRLGLVSSAQKDEIKMILNYFNLNDCFEVIITSEDVNNGKPHPEPYLLAAKKICINPRMCVVIEDSKNGVMSAKSAGMYCIGFHNKNENQDLSKADAEVRSLKEISINFLKRL